MWDHAKKSMEGSKLSDSCSKPLSTVCNEIGNFFKNKKIARTKTKVFLDCNGHNLFRTVEKTLKKSNRLVTVKLQKKRGHILLIFPVLGKMTHMT